MYLEYFALQSHPFRITPDPAMFWPGAGRGVILEALIYAITTGEGIVKVVGEVGSGKTMLCRILEERLPRSVEIVYLANPRLSPAEILYAIAFELKLPVSAETGRLLLMQHLQSYLLEQHSAGRNVVVFIEEAQGMPMETLEEIRLLSNLETHHHKLLQIVVFGQPELDNNLRNSHIRQLKERITHSFYLAPLGTSEVAEYLASRLQTAGCASPGLFGRGAVKLITKASRGLIRRINILADKAMLAAYSASGSASFSEDAAKRIESRHVQLAIGDCEFDQSATRPVRLAGYCLLFLVFAFVATVAWHYFPFTRALPSFLDFKAVIADSLASASSLLAIDKDMAPSGSENQATEDHRSKQAEQTRGKQLPSPQETLLVTELMETAQPLPPVSEHFFPRTTNLLVEDILREEGDIKKPRDKTAPEVRQPPGTPMLDHRRKASDQWLQEVHPDNFTVQLLAANLGDEMYLEKFLQRISSQAVREKSYVCLVRQGERDHWVVLFDEFQGVNPARLALDSLPPELQRARPFVRNLRKVLNLRPVAGQ